MQINIIRFIFTNKDPIYTTNKGYLIKIHQYYIHILKEINIILLSENRKKEIKIKKNVILIKHFSICDHSILDFFSS